MPKVVSSQELGQIIDLIAKYPDVRGAASLVAQGAAFMKPETGKLGFGSEQAAD